MPTIRLGRHENGQNFLTDRAVIATFVDLVASTRGPILEIGPGDGALSVPLTRLGRPLTVVEIDPRLARRVRRRLPRQVRVVTADVLTRRRAGVGGATMMTAQWAPWFTFTLHSRIPAGAFPPRPGVDGGLLVVHRREQPLLPLIAEAGGLALAWPLLIEIAENLAAQEKIPATTSAVLETLLALLPEIPHPVELPNIRALAGSKGKSKAITLARAIGELL